MGAAVAESLRWGITKDQIAGLSLASQYAALCQLVRQNPHIYEYLNRDAFLFSQQILKTAESKLFDDPSLLATLAHAHQQALPKGVTMLVYPYSGIVFSISGEGMSVLVPVLKDTHIAMNQVTAHSQLIGVDTYGIVHSTECLDGLRQQVGNATFRDSGVPFWHDANRWPAADYIAVAALGEMPFELLHVSLTQKLPDTV